MQIDVIKEVAIEFGNPQSEQCQLNHSVGRSVKTPSKVIQKRRQFCLRLYAILRRRANGVDLIRRGATRMEPRVTTVEHLQSIPVSSHSADDNRREHFAEHLNQRQRSVVGQADVTAALVDVVDKINVPRAWRHLRVCFCLLLL